MLSRIKSYLLFWRKQHLDTYLGIKDLTLNLWWEIHETGDVSLLIKNPFKLTKDVVDSCSDIWDDIRQQHIDAFGMPEEYKDYLRKLADVAIAKLQYAISDDRTDKMFAKIAQLELDDIISQPKQSNQEAMSIIELSLDMRYPIDPQTTTVEKYYGLVKLAQKKAAHGKSN